MQMGDICYGFRLNNKRVHSSKVIYPSMYVSDINSKDKGLDLIGAASLVMDVAEWCHDCVLTSSHDS